MARWWLLIFVSVLLFVTDHGRFWTDDLVGEMFPDDQISFTVSHRLPGCSLQQVDLQPVVLPPVLVCLAPQPELIEPFGPPVDGRSPSTPGPTRIRRIRPPPHQA
jgi:hypothetical protein